MKIATIRTKLKQPVLCPGLLKGHLEYTVSTADSTVEWIGPKITPSLWNTVLEFFRDTNARTHSECQVRLYVNATENKWVAWAFPQEARTGMSAREIDNAEAKEQRTMFKDSEGWYYAGTVHHHCNCRAFQSGTDHSNEKPQDGLHVTIGCLNDARYDMHARFYHDGLEYTPDMSVFWDIGDLTRSLVPFDCHDKAARWQMTCPPPADATYPEQWKTNLIEPPPPPAPKVEENLIVRGVMGYQSGGNAAATAGNGNGGNGGSLGHTFYKGYGLTEAKRIEACLDSIFEECQRRGMDLLTVANIFKLLADSPFTHALKNESGHHRVLAWDVINEWARQRDELEAKEIAQAWGLEQ